MKEELTYSQSGVDIDLADSAKSGMEPFLETQDERVLNRIGAFASLFEASFPRMANPVLVLKIEEPGSKQQLALEHMCIRSLSYDIVNHLVNDIIVMGATPLAVLDAIICGKLDKSVVVELVRCMSEACREQSCTLVGGETSEQPGVLSTGQYVLCASIVGVVDRTRIIDGSRIRSGDVVIGVQSSGPHTNGYTLIRHLLRSDEQLADRMIGGKSFLDAVLQPHRCYYNAIKGLLGDRDLHGLAHITGGGLGGNVNRILPEGVGVSIDLSSFPIPLVFLEIQHAGNIPQRDMIRTFNLGVGMALVVPPSAVERIMRHVQDRGCTSHVIGEVREGERDVTFHGQIHWH